MSRTFDEQTGQITMGLRRTVSGRRKRAKFCPSAELTAHIKRLLEKSVGSVWVSGEITNLRAQSSGHVYFTLKDAAAQLSCVLFSARNSGAARAARGRTESFAARRRDGL